MSEIHEVGSAVEFVLKRPEVFFEHGVATAEGLIAEVLDSIEPARRTEVTVVRHASWTVMSAPFDWIARDEYTLEAVFSRFVIPKPFRGPNRHNPEVLLAAVCDGVGTFGPAGELWLRLQRADVPPNLLSGSPPDGRTLVWRLEA